MLAAHERSILRRKLEQYEGRVPHMYLDTAGHVTVGVGHLLATVADAERLPFITDSGTRATSLQIADDFRNVASEPLGYYAHHYRRVAKLTLSNAEIDRLTERHVDSFHRELRALYSKFDEFPSPARLALFDMIFNLGASRLRAQYPAMNRAIADLDWEKAAAESNRKPPISPIRNAYVRQLFQQAASSTEPAL